MLLQIASEKTLQTTPAAPLPPCPPRPKVLADLTRSDCRFCIADTAEGAMHGALFCAAPTRAGPYCSAHDRLCRVPAPDDADALAAEIEASRAR